MALPSEGLTVLLEFKGPQGFREARYTPEQLERMLFAKKVWTKTKSLLAVGRALGVSGERARQLLDKGSALGLYRFRQRRKGPGAPTVHLIMDWPKVIQIQRVRLGVNSGEFARLLGVSGSALSNWEVGKSSPALAAVPRSSRFASSANAQRGAGSGLSIYWRQRLNEKAYNGDVCRTAPGPSGSADMGGHALRRSV